MIIKVDVRGINHCITVLNFCSQKFTYIFVDQPSSNGTDWNKCYFTTKVEDILDYIVTLIDTINKTRQWKLSWWSKTDEINNNSIGNNN